MQEEKRWLVNGSEETIEDLHLNDETKDVSNLDAFSDWISETTRIETLESLNYTNNPIEASFRQVQSLSTTAQANYSWVHDNALALRSTMNSYEPNEEEIVRMEKLEEEVTNQFSSLSESLEQSSNSLLSTAQAIQNQQAVHEFTANLLNRATIGSMLMVVGATAGITVVTYLTYRYYKNRQSLNLEPESSVELFIDRMIERNGSVGRLFRSWFGQR